MNRRERHIYENGIVIAAVFIIAAVIVMTIPQPQNVAFAAPMIEGEEIIEESTATSETADFDANSAMPCIDTESFRRWYETYEPEASEEVRSDDGGQDHEDDGTTAETETTAAEVESTMPVLYRIAGQEIDASLQVRLYQHLSEAGIEWWYEGALAQMFQESHCQQYAENPNGLDKGIYQFRSTYWDWSSGDIFDTDAQMRRYAAETAARFNAGLSTDEVISRHNTSDFVTAVNWEYVSDVKQWLGQMESVSK